MHNTAEYELHSIVSLLYAGVNLFIQMNIYAIKIRLEGLIVTVSWSILIALLFTLYIKFFFSSV